MFDRQLQIVGDFKRRKKKKRILLIGLLGADRFRWKSIIMNHQRVSKRSQSVISLAARDSFSNFENFVVVNF